ncbi:B-type cyclin [Spathaspora passalidarum NRRL Y-27907]|uniref:B-type cyclin n=1 Tax=Spathaspora passalidarum (strain NRRL Y-27907 / 11-Y1) TaxID=619300 RepID=G3AUX1_SPAPN|nr:B-type cyclin [Spathaspora passalidarum NRRL Y-27907]EGW30062.1 B-type cyclin [Spathaspora passalidarum NRRL Y-27907]
MQTNFDISQEDQYDEDALLFEHASEKLITNSDSVDDIDISQHVIDKNELDSEDEELEYQKPDEDELDTQEQSLRSPFNTHIPMQPTWTPSIIAEMRRVVHKYSRDTLDEDDEDTYDPAMVAEYAPEIFNYLHELENKLAPDANYMDNQDELKWEMRSVLIDWVVQVHSRFNLLSETLFLTVNYIDRFLSKRKVSLSRFQLVGAVALFIAAKYEEINCPTVQEVAYMADNAYTIDEFLKAERFMIDVLEFDMGWPGPMSFLRRTSKADDYDYETRTLAKYFLEITIMDSKFVASPPSWLAASAHYLSRKLLNRGEWTELHVFYSGYTERQLRPVAEILLESCRHAETNHKAIFEKYSERRYRRSSIFVQEYFDSL